VSVVGLFGVRLNVRNLDLAEQFYTSLGMVEDIGMRIDAGHGPRSVIAEPHAENPRSISLRWPCDPYMHLNLAALAGSAPRAGWPKGPNQLGSTTISLLVDDLDAELRRLGSAGHAVAAGPSKTIRECGSSTSAFITDPDGNSVELIQVDYDRGWGYAGCSVAGAERTFLHFELNTENHDRVSDFYAGFGFTHNPLNNLRPDYSPAFEAGAPDPYVEAFGQTLNGKMSGVNFYRLPNDHSQMHLEVMGWLTGTLQDPAEIPTFHQRGVMRYCFKVRGLDSALAEAKRRGIRIYQEQQRCGLGWGDSEWFYFADPDGNVLCFEEWHPAYHWGERD
jgi:predicted enzyme related to lactoylglutathione lyase